jgi:hypothetical protein
MHRVSDALLEHLRGGYVADLGKRIALPPRLQNPPSPCLVGLPGKVSPWKSSMFSERQRPRFIGAGVAPRD